MEFKRIFLIAAACLLARMEIVSSLDCLSSAWKSGRGCGRGNLMKINTNNCTTVAGNKQCEVKSTGTNTRDNKTRFEIVEVNKLNKLYKCIQFTDINNSNKKYALKAINGINLTFEEGGCHSNIGSDFLFEEATTTKYNTYRPSKYTNKCVTGDCDGRLFLTSVNNVKKDRKCFFRKIPV